MSDNNIKSLPAGYILQGNDYKYEIKQVLGQGAFGITYLASMEVEVEGALGKIKTSSPVTIKEFFMSEINGRKEASVTSGEESTLYGNYKRKFTREAENLSNLKHKNIVKVLEYFEANNTVYYVMEFLRNGSLNDIIESKGHLSDNETVKYTKQICEALKYMHSRQILHLDLKPKNIMLNDKMEAVLIDFGLSKHYDNSGNPESSTSIGGGTPGYSPIEQAQYKQDGTFQSTLDIYALGATMYKMISGKRPPEASEILNEGFNDKVLKDAGTSQQIISIIEKAMMPIKKNRYQTVDEIQSALNALNICNENIPETKVQAPPVPNKIEDDKTELQKSENIPTPSASDDETEIIVPAGKNTENARTAPVTAPSAQKTIENIPRLQKPVKKSNNKMIIIIIVTIVVLVILAIAGIGLIAVAGSSNKKDDKSTEKTTSDNKNKTTAETDITSSNSAESVSKQFAQALLNGDFDTIYDLCFTQKTKGEFMKDFSDSYDIFTNINKAGGKIDVLSVKTEGNEGVAKFSIQVYDENETIPVPLIYTNGKWKIYTDTTEQDSPAQVPELSPEEVATQFVDALLNGDISNASNLCYSKNTTEEINALLISLSKFFKKESNDGAEINADSPNVEGDKAYSYLNIISGEKNLGFPLPLTKTYEGWKVDLDAE